MQWFAIKCFLHLEELNKLLAALFRPIDKLNALARTNHAIRHESQSLVLAV